MFACFQPDVDELRHARRQQRERAVAAHHDRSPRGHVRWRGSTGRVRLHVQADVRHVAAAGHRCARLLEAAGVAHFQRQQSASSPLSRRSCRRRRRGRLPSPSAGADQRAPFVASPCAPPVQHERLELHRYVNTIRTTNDEARPIVIVTMTRSAAHSVRPKKKKKHVINSTPTCDLSRTFPRDPMFLRLRFVALVLWFLLLYRTRMFQTISVEFGARGKHARRRATAIRVPVSANCVCAPLQRNMSLVYT